MTKIEEQIKAVEDTIKQLEAEIYCDKLTISKHAIPLSEAEKKNLIERKELLMQVSENLNLLNKIK